MEEFGPPRKRRRGGIGQRMEAAAPGPADSTLARFLLYNVAWGVMSPQLAQRLAQMALEDFKTSSASGGALVELEHLANAGASGKHVNNVNRSVMKYAGAKSLLPVPFKPKLPYKMGFGEQTTAILLPHEMFAAIYHSYPDAWQTSICPGAMRLGEFWDSQASHPQMGDHPVKTRGDWKRHAVPLGLHGDEVPLVGVGKCWVRMQLTFSWFSLAGARGIGTKQSLLYIWSALDKLSVEGPGGTVDQFMEILTWSFFWLWKGLWPDRDHTGKKSITLA